MNELHARYADKGLLVVGVHITRKPRIRKENIVHALEKLRPAFPVVNTAWVGAMPVSHLPWVAVFDHEGDRIHAGAIQGIGPIVESALERAPHYILGGPYDRLGELAGEIAADSAHLGRHVKKLRQRISVGRGEPALHDEARALLDSIETHGYSRAEKIIEEVSNPAEAAPALGALAAQFEGDLLGELFALIAESIESAPGFKKERTALGALDEARALCRKLPPAGTYTYNLEYIEITDEKRRSERERAIFRYRKSLEKIIDTHRGTCAAATASDLFEETFGAARSKDLDVEETVDGDLVDEAKQIMNEIYHIGSGLSHQKAEELGTRLGEIAREVNARTVLAGEIGAFMRDVEWSFAGRAMPDFLVDAAYEGPGIALRTVFDFGCASRAGLEAGDLILGGDGEAIKDFRDFYKHLARCRPGQSVDLLVRKRSGAKAETVDLVLGRRLR